MIYGVTEKQYITTKENTQPIQTHESSGICMQCLLTLPLLQVYSDSQNVSSENISLNNSVTVAYLKLLLTPTSWLLKRSLPSVTLMIWSSGREMKRILLIWLSNLHPAGVDLELEDNAARFLGAHMNNPKIGFLNRRIMVWSIEYLHQQWNCKWKGHTCQMETSCRTCPWRAWLWCDFN